MTARRGRPPDPGRKDELRERVLAHLEKHGLAASSLRSLAAALGVSTYALTYHFGSGEGVVAAALDLAERRQRAMVEGWRAEGLALQDLVRRYWSWCADPANRGRVRLTMEAYGADAVAGEGGGSVSAWVPPWLALLGTAALEAGVEPDRAEAIGTLVVAAMSGLALDLLASGDAARTGAAAEALAALVSAPG